MSRSGYVDDCDSDQMLAVYGWNANVRRCLRGREGQAFLWTLYQALEALPDRRIIQGSLVDREGSACSLGAVALFRGMAIPDDWKETAEGEPDEYEFMEAMGPLFKIKDMLAREIMYQNDDCDDRHELPGPTQQWRCSPSRYDLPEERWQRMRAWAVSQLRGIP